MVYVFQMFFSWDRRSQGTFPAVLRPKSLSVCKYRQAVSHTGRLMHCPITDKFANPEGIAFFGTCHFYNHDHDNQSMHVITRSCSICAHLRVKYGLLKSR